MAILRQYQALLTARASVERVKAARREIERAGGRVQMMTRGTVTVVLLELPPPLLPEQFVPGLPFYPA